MLFNNNIMLEILRSNFSKDILLFVDECVMDKDEYELESVFGEDVDFALLGNVNEMTVVDYDVEKDFEEDKEYIDGELDIVVNVDGYKHVDDEIVFVEHGTDIISIGFRFEKMGEKYSDIQLEKLS